MIAGSNVLDAPAGRQLPRAFEPGLADSLNLPETRPGWDLGPERRIDDGRSIARMLAMAAIGLALIGLGAALLRARRSDG